MDESFSGSPEPWVISRSHHCDGMQRSSTSAPPVCSTKQSVAPLCHRSTEWSFCCQRWPQHAPTVSDLQGESWKDLRHGRHGRVRWLWGAYPSYWVLWYVRPPKTEQRGRVVDFAVDLPQVSFGIGRRWQNLANERCWSACLQAVALTLKSTQVRTQYLGAQATKLSHLSQFILVMCWANCRLGAAMSISCFTLDASLWRMSPKWIARFSFWVLQTSRLGWYHCWFFMIFQVLKCFKTPFSVNSYL